VTEDPYEILVSEVMSQQTQLGRVVEAWNDFLDRWPTAADLAASDRADIVGFWTNHSLGYNNRAKYLHEAARQVTEEYDGQFPETPDELQGADGRGALHRQRRRVVRVQQRRRGGRHQRQTGPLPRLRRAGRRRGLRAGGPER